MVEILQESNQIVQIGNLKNIIFNGLLSTVVKRHLHVFHNLDYPNWKAQLLQLDNPSSKMSLQSQEQTCRMLYPVYLLVNSNRPRPRMSQSLTRFRAF
jgi:hypothetical protein